MKIIIVITVIAVVLWLVIYSTRSMMKQSKKDWQTVYDLENKSKTISTKEEVIIFHKEFVEKATKINNEYCQVKLAQIDGYLRGLYKVLNTH